MPPIEISFTETALRNLEDVRAWYAGQGVPDVGTRLEAEIVQHIQTLAEHPDMGGVAPEFGQHFLREIIHPPFRVVYWRDALRVRIVLVWRSEHQLPPSQGRS